MGATNRTAMMVSAAAALLSGCTGGAVPGMMPPVTDPNVAIRTGEGHFITFTTRALNGPSQIVDRSGRASEVKVTTQMVNGKATSADVEIVGPLAGGTVVSSIYGLPAVEGGFERERRSDVGAANDAFLQVAAGKSHTLFGYNRTTGDSPTIGGYGYAGMIAVGDKTANMPTSGSATYRGQATAYLFPHTSTNEVDRANVRELNGSVGLTASFNPGGGSVSGRIADTTIKTAAANSTVPLGLDIVLNPATMSGNSYQGGTLRLVRSGTNTTTGSVVSSGYEGFFFGDAAAEAAGTFQFAATGIAIPGVGNNQNVQAVGGFSASK